MISFLTQSQMSFKIFTLNEIEGRSSTEQKIIICQACCLHLLWKIHKVIKRRHLQHNFNTFFSVVSIYIKVYISKQNSSDALYSPHMHSYSQIFHMLFYKITYVVLLIQGQINQLNRLQGNKFSWSLMFC